MNIIEKDIVKVTTSKTGEYAKNFWMFLKNILMLFRKNFKELMFFLLFCNAFSALATSFLKQFLKYAMMKAAAVFEKLGQVARAEKLRAQAKSV